MILTKAIGYILIAAGLATLIITCFYSYNIYTGKASAPIIFQIPVSVETSSGPQSLQDQIEQTVQKQISQVLPPAIFSKILNLATWSLFAFILIFAGGTIASIGIKLIK